MDFETPSWLTKEFVINTLQNGKDSKVTIEEMKICMPVPKGNNYATDIYGVEVEYSTSNDKNKLQKKSFIIKVPKREANNPIIKENVFYNEYLPKLQSIIGCNVENCDYDDDEESFTAKSYFSSEQYVVILEDLKVKGYSMVDRLIQLDYEHCFVALKALAKFHAVSVVLHEKYPKLVEKIGKEGVFRHKFKEQHSESIANNFEIIIKYLKKLPGYEKSSHWFEENKYNLWNYIEDEMRPKENELNVLNHGDFWLTNMLFRYNADHKPIKSKLIDFQGCRYCSPAIDFVFFIDSSAQDIVRNERVSDLIAHYVKELNLKLERYGCSKRLEEAEFKKSIATRTHYRVIVLTTTLAIVLADPYTTKFMDKKSANSEESKNNENNPFETYLSNERFLKTLARRIEQFEKDELFKK